MSITALITTLVTSILARKLLKIMPKLAWIIFDLVSDAERMFTGGVDKKEYVMDTIRKLYKAGGLISTEFLGVDLPNDLDDRIIKALDEIVEGAVTVISLFQNVGSKDNIVINWDTQEVTR